jgi:hypothetical protein
MNARKLALGGLLAAVMGLGLTTVASAGVVQNDSPHPIYIQAAYYDSQLGFVWGDAVLLQPGTAVQVVDGDNVFTRALNLNGEWGPAWQPGTGAQTDYLFVVGAMVYYDVTRR